MEKKNAIVIGATSGIGRQVARQWAEQGYKVGITGRRKMLLEELKAEKPDAYQTALFDVADPDACHALSDLVKCMGHVDRILLSAGTGNFNEQLEYPIEEDTNRVNIEGFTQIATWAFRYFQQQGGGHLIAITSVMGLRGSGAAPAYAASKAYQINYLEGLRQRAAKQHVPVLVTDIRPGSVRTDMMKGDGHFWIASPQQAARTICRAVEKHKSVQYVTPRWRFIGTLLKIIPRSLYRKML